MANSKIHLKVVIVGDGTCGKTSLLYRFARDEFPEAYIPTVFENYTYEMPLEDGQLVDLVLQDTAGQEDYDKIRPLSYQDAHIVMFCYDIGRPETFKDISTKWVAEVEYYIPSVLRFLVGLKSDLRTSGERSIPSKGNPEFSDEKEPPPAPVSPEQAEELGTRLLFDYWGECSAKTGDNIYQTFYRAALIGCAKYNMNNPTCCRIL